VTGPSQAGTTANVNVLLVDDHALLRQALRMLLESRPGLHVVGDCGDGRTALELARQLRPDVVLMDVAMPGLDGLETTRRIKREAPESRVILLTSYADQERLREGLRAGARGYVVKRSEIEELVLAIQMVVSGNTYVSTELANRVDVGRLMYEALRARDIYLVAGCAVAGGTLVAAGNFDWDNFVALVEKHCGAWPAPSGPGSC